MQAHSESVADSVSFADKIGPTGNYPGEFQQEAKGETTFAIKDLKFTRKKVKKLSTSDYEVLVNVFSGRRNLKSNVLDCGLLQDVISKLQHKVHEVHCELGNWVPAKKR